LVGKLDPVKDNILNKTLKKIYVATATFLSDISSKINSVNFQQKANSQINHEKPNMCIGEIRHYIGQERGGKGGAE